MATTGCAMQRLEIRSVLLTFTLPIKNIGGYELHGQLFPPQDFELDVLEEAYTTEHWIVRIYKVKDLENRGI